MVEAKSTMEVDSKVKSNMLLVASLLSGPKRGDQQRRPGLRLRRLNTELLDAVDVGDADEVVRLLENGANVNATCCPLNVSAVHLASLQGHATILTVLLDRGALVERRDAVDRSPIHLAAWAGHRECVAILLKRKPELVAARTGTAKAECEAITKEWQDTRNHEHQALDDKLPDLEPGSTPLHIASQMAHKECIQTLLQAGADHAATDHCMMTPLDVVGELLVVGRGDEAEWEATMTASKERFPQSIQTLLDAGARVTTEIKAVGTFRETAMHTAVELQSLKSIRLLASAGYTALFWDKNGATPIHLAVNRRVEKPLKVLLDACRSDEMPVVDLRDQAGRTPLHVAVESQWMTGVCVFLEAGADVEATTPNNETVLHLAAERGNAEILAELLKVSEDSDGNQLQIIDTPTKSTGETPLFRAVVGGSIECVSLLINAKADVSVKIAYEYTMLHRATENDYPEILELLLQQDVDKKKSLIESMDTARMSGMTPLLMAAKTGSLRCVQVLLRYGCNTRAKVAESPANSKQCTGETALHIAALFGNEPIVQELVKHDRSLVKEKDARGWRPIHVATKNGHRQCVRHLLAAGADLSSRCRDEHTDRTSLDLLLNNISRPVSFLEKSFDSCITSNDYPISNPNCVITLDYNILFPRGEDSNQLKVLDALGVTGNRYGQQSLLLHPLIQSFLYLKWKKLRGFFYGLIMLYFVFVLSFTMLCIMMYYYDDVTNPLPDALNVDACRYVVIVVDVLLVLIELINVSQRPLLYLKDPESWLKIISFALAMAVSIVTHTDDNDAWHRHVTTVAILFAWTQCLFLLSRVPHFGFYILMFSRVTMNVLQVLLLFIFLMIGFALTFMIQFQAQPPFDSPWESLLKTYMMMTGEYDYTGLFDAGDEASAVISRILFMIFVIFVGISFMNLLVGMAVSDITALEVKGQMSGLRKQADFLSLLEMIIFNGFFLKLMPTKLIAKLDRLRQVNAIVSIKPSVTEAKTFSVAIKDSIIFRVSANYRVVSEPTLSDVYQSLMTLTYTMDVVSGARIKASDHMDVATDGSDEVNKLDRLCREVEAMSEMMKTLLARKSKPVS